MTALRTLVLAAAALLLAGCLPVLSTTPVGTTVGFSEDPALFGTWRGQDLNGKDQRDVFLHFLKGRDGQTTAALILAGGTSDDEWEIYALRPARLGANRFLNAVLQTSNGTPPEDKLKNANIPLLYTLSSKTLTLYWLDDDKTADAIKAGLLQGVIGPGDNGDITITASATDLDGVMAKPEAAKLFKILLVLTKAD
jgi:hypothetical protein